MSEQKAENEAAGGQSALSGLVSSGITEELREAACNAVAEALGDAYDCTRVWSAWGYGTMGPDDFASVAEDDDRVAEIVDAVIGVLTANAKVS